MSNDIDLDGFFEGLAEFFGDLFGSDPASISQAMAAPVKPTEPQENPKYPIGSKWRVLENEWWHNVTTEDVMVVKESTKLDILFSHPRGGVLVVPLGMIGDFEEVTDGASTGKEVPGTLA
jgi:hypothetical protein|uniref:Uncharacterized protein n=1 Tax=Myoviridae sp. ctshb19 TaxID=2825194 RepID=A0A8S5UGR3_9CAUD|nr:MAG TPA: hypothetical protein [Myoviridae sp. ctshb19]